MTHRAIAGVLLALAALVYLTRPDLEDLRSWTPVSYPIPPAPGRVDIPPFIAAADREFHLFLYGESANHACPPAAIEWTIIRNGNVEASGTSQADKLGFFDNATACWIAELPAQRGQQYAVSLNVHSVALTNPKLLVQTYPNAWLDASTGKALHRDLAAVASALLALAGTTLLLVKRTLTATTH